MGVQLDPGLELHIEPSTFKELVLESSSARVASTFSCLSMGCKAFMTSSLNLSGFKVSESLHLILTETDWKLKLHSSLGIHENCLTGKWHMNEKMQQVFSLVTVTI